MHKKIIATKIKTNTNSDWESLKKIVTDEPWYLTPMIMGVMALYLPRKALYNTLLVPYDLNYFINLTLQELNNSKHDLQDIAIKNNDPDMFKLTIDEIDWVIKQREVYGDLDTILGRTVNWLSNSIMIQNINMDF